MHIVGIEGAHPSQVHTIDIWFSDRRQVWCVERLDADGHQIGLTHHCEDEDEAAACLVDWLRSHDEAHLVAPRPPSAAEKRLIQRLPRHMAA